MGYEVAPVVYVNRKDAKAAKNELEAKKILNRSLRMVVTKDNDQWIAIPVLSCGGPVDVSTHTTLQLSVPIVGRGMYECPQSSRNHATEVHSSEASSLTAIQAILVQTQRENETLVQPKANPSDEQNITSKVRTLGLESCPAKLEVLGDDRTVVIPLKALRMDDLKVLGEFWTKEQAYPYLWKALAEANGSSRVVRRGEIDPNSPTRHSQYQLLWYDSSLDRFSDESGVKWITVVEDGIKQTFHLERVMFCRGNITEKMRFGRRLVQPGEEVLDLYAGIGYFTLPAAVHGRAHHVTCCEWNPEAGRSPSYAIRAKQATNHSSSSGSVETQCFTQPSPRDSHSDTS